MSVTPTFSFSVLCVLLVMLTASGRMFYVLARQWSQRRPMAALLEWAKDRGFAVEPPSADLPESLRGLSEVDAQMELKLARGPITLIRLTTASKSSAARPAWNLLIRQVTTAQSPAGLRPVNQIDSFLDLFALSGFPSLLPPERFVVFAIDSREGRAMAANPARGLLPPDIGLLLHGPYLTIDFSARPFDVIEFDRMLTVMEQIVKIAR